MRNFFNETKWLLGIIGLLMLVVGIFLLVRPIGTMIFGTMLIGLALMIAGIFYFVSFFFNLKAPWAGWMMITAIINFLVGALLLARPSLSLDIIVFLFGLWAIALGASVFANSFAARTFRHSGWGWQLVGGLLGILVGILIIFNPLAGFVTLNWIIAVAFIFYGIANIIGAFYLNNHTKELNTLYKALRF
ncbi:MAG: DUF308 domain-containing protein [bacterium]|nr:DUF308 domain-containing protein [bacterium]